MWLMQCEICLGDGGRSGGEGRKGQCLVGGGGGGWDGGVPNHQKLFGQ